MSRTIAGSRSLGLLAAVLGVLGCGAVEDLPAKPSGLKVLIVGIDGATFSVIDPLLDAGRLPQMREMIRGGARGPLRSVPPLTSPAIWTTIATGRSRAVHGITSWRGRQALVSSNDRKVSALWNWPGLFGSSVGFQGWWASWPAETVDGWILSDRIVRSRFTEWGESAKEGLTYPEELFDEIRELVVDPEDPPLDEIASLVSFTAEEIEELQAARSPIFAHWLSVFKFAFCTQRSFEEMALRLLPAAQPDLAGVFLVANDPISHTFWHFYEPQAFDGVDPEAASRLGVMIPNFYAHNDRFIGELTSRLDANTVVLVVSDHGFQATGKLPEKRPRADFKALQALARREGFVSIGQPGGHHRDGVFIAAGPPIRKGVHVQAHILDVAPTVLALLGLPVPEDLEGRVLTEILRPEFLETYPVQHIPSYEPYVRRGILPDGQRVNEQELLERLRAVGYLE